MNFDAANLENCPRSEIAAYLDGELSPGREMQLESHFAVCGSCRQELNEQKRLLFALDEALEEQIEIPSDFARVVTANAESRVAGLRCPVERGRAFLVCLILGLLVAFGLGADSVSSTGFLNSAVERGVAVAAFFGRIVFDLAVAASVILRSICFQFVFKSAVSVISVAAVCVGSVVFVSRMLRQNKF